MEAGERILIYIIVFVLAMITIVSGVADEKPQAKASPTTRTNAMPKKMMRVEVEETSNPDFLKVTVDSCHQYLAQRYGNGTGVAGGMAHLAGCEYCKKLKEETNEKEAGSIRAD